MKKEEFVCNIKFPLGTFAFTDICTNCGHFCTSHDYPERDKKMKYNFGNIVMVEKGLVGVVVKSWESKDSYNHDVYVRSFNAIKNYQESEMRHFIYDKELSDEDLTYY